LSPSHQPILDCCMLLSLSHTCSIFLHMSQYSECYSSAFLSLYINENICVTYVIKHERCFFCVCHICIYIWNYILCCTVARLYYPFFVEGDLRLLVEQLCYVYIYFVRCTNLTIMSYISGIVMCCLCVRNSFSKLTSREHCLRSARD
jgi:hypothetical protein